MFRNFWVIAARNFWRNKIFSLINVAGLAIGISAALVIFLIVQHELGYEKHVKDKDRIYRVVSNMHFPDSDFKNAGVPGPLVAAARTGIPSIEASTYFWTLNRTKVQTEASNGKENIFRKQEHIIYADDQYFRFFPYTWVAGKPDLALDGPNKVVLTESRARAYFSFNDISQAIGQTLI